MGSIKVKKRDGEDIEKGFEGCGGGFGRAEVLGRKTLSFIKTQGRGGNLRKMKGSTKREEKEE